MIGWKIGGQIRKHREKSKGYRMPKLREFTGVAHSHRVAVNWLFTSSSDPRPPSFNRNLDDSLEFNQNCRDLIVFWAAPLVF
jgi:hypothetical protein